MPISALLAALTTLVVGATACSSEPAAARSSSLPHTASQAATSITTPQTVALPTPAPPPWAIESLRTRAYPGGQIQIGDEMLRGPGFTKHHMTWPSGGQTMTGTISIPDGHGPFPVVVVNHGFIPPNTYWIGQDSGIFGDPMAAHGFISVAPNWPGYAGSGPAPAELPQIVGQVVATLDLISSLRSLPQADTSRVALIGHSNGGGISEIAMVVDWRITAVVLHAPVSSDMADNARKWWLQRPESLGSLGTPDANPAGYRLLSPRNYFRSYMPPVLIVQGTSDHTIPADWTNATFSSLQQAGVESKLIWVPGADHDLVGSDLDGAVTAQEAWIRHAFHM